MDNLGAYPVAWYPVGSNVCNGCELMTRALWIGTFAGWCVIVAAAGFLVAGSAEDQHAPAKALAGISGERMLADVIRLSSPEFNGRQTGTIDDHRSGSFVAERFKSLGLLAAGTETIPGDSSLESWAMKNPLKVSTIQTTPVLEFSPRATTLAGRARLGEQFLPILDSPSVKITAPLAFVGYGISDPARGFDEYEGIDVKDRVVIFFRGKPEQYPPSITHAEKVKTAREKGAAAFLMTTGPVISAYESRRGISGAPSAFYNSTPEEFSLPGAWISTSLATLVTNELPSLSDIQKTLNRATTPQSAVLHVETRLEWQAVQGAGSLTNVLGMIQGSSEEMAVVGAHRDHFGRQAGLLFAGADDNASGTAVLLEVARAIVQSGLKPKRSILFISFSGEEQGLLGSKLYVARPIIPLTSTKAMINVDHAGAGNGRLTVGITGFEKDVAAQAGQAAGLADKLDLFGFFPGGDHVPFKEAGVPTVTVVSGGAHPHFHQPTDTADTVNPNILQTTARYVLALTWQLANAP